MNNVEEFSMEHILQHYHLDLIIRTGRRVTPTGTTFSFCRNEIAVLSLSSLAQTCKFPEWNVSIRRFKPTNPGTT